MSNAKEKIKEIATKEQKDAMKEMLRMADKSKVDEVKQMLEYTQKGTAKATVGNYMVVLRNDPLVRESMKYNKLTGRIDIVKKLWWNEEICKLDDDGRTYFYYFFERYYKLTSEKCMDKALRIEANSRAYHPICEYLEQLEWDGQERIRYVLQRYMGADASDFVYEVVKHFLMEALSRIYRPGCKADEMLCLVGQQGAGKSTFFRFLALNDDWFSDDLKQLNDSKIYEHLRGHWIMEMSEMIAAISAKSNEEIKSFLTRQKDTYRNPYDKYEEDRKRQCIFAGSTNTRQFIPFDRTGARRFLPIAIDSSKAEKHILDDEKEARAYFDQLWAEAMEIYWSTENKSSLLKFSKEMEQKISEYRKQFTQEDTMAGMIQDWLDAYKGTHVCSVQIWKEAFDHFEREPKKFETNEICSIMDTQITGWKRDGIHRFSKEGYGRQRSWVREGTEEGGNEPDKDGTLENTDQSINKLCHVLPPVLKRGRGVVHTGLAPAVGAAAHRPEGVLAIAHCVDGGHDGSHHITGNAFLHLGSRSSGLLHRGSGLCRGGRLGGSSLCGSLLLAQTVEDLALQRDDRHQQHEDQEHQHDTGNGNDDVKT